MVEVEIRRVQNRCGKLSNFEGDKKKKDSFQNRKVWDVDGSMSEMLKGGSEASVE